MTAQPAEVRKRLSHIALEIKIKREIIEQLRTETKKLTEERDEIRRQHGNQDD